VKRAALRSVVVAPDSFKGSLTAEEAARSIGAGVREVCPDARILLHPVSDGGEGLVQVLTPHLGGEQVTTRVHGPLPGTVVDARWILCREKSLAVLEMAEAAGLLHVPPAQRDPKVTTTRGVGELISAALDAGVREIIVGIGGSATNDGGAGMAESLGVRFFDSGGIPLPPGGGALTGLASIDLSGLDPRVRGVRFTIAGDVANPLLGPRGATAVYAPQKGARAAEIPLLEAGLARLAALVETATGIEIGAVPGSGAAGGLGGGLIAFCGASFTPGIDLVLDLTRFDDVLTGADLVITGEGKLDAQSSSGKAVAGVVRRAQRHLIPVVALAGTAEGVDIAFLAVGTLVNDRTTVAEAMGDAAGLLRKRTAELLDSLCEP
jgi:glycerate 2-kinase